MNKANDFWTPRRREFDDESPLPFETRREFARERGRLPNAIDDSIGGGGGAPASSPSVEATVKWFKDDKGFGFVELENGQGDAFLHVTALRLAGHESVPPGARMRVVVAAGGKGPQVAKVLSVDASTAIERPRRSFDGLRPPRRAPADPSAGAPLDGKVKWFNESKGFGFVEAEDGGKDVFVHVSALNAAGIARLNEGQAVNMRVVETPRGREAISISV